jgi:heme/copper-type cytochrome/quinol oxidase subunit 1
MATFEGPMLSLKSVNAISHFTDWTIAHVHVGGLGWNGMLTFGILYWLIPRIFKTELFSKRPCQLPFLDRNAWNYFLCSANVLGRFPASFYVETIYRCWSIEVPVH